MHSRKIGGRMEGQKMVKKVDVLLQWVSMFSQAMERNHERVLWGAWSFHAWTAILDSVSAAVGAEIACSLFAPPLSRAASRLDTSQEPFDGHRPVSDEDESPKVRGLGRASLYKACPCPLLIPGGFALRKIFYARNSHEWLHNLFRLKRRRRNRNVQGENPRILIGLFHLHV